MNTVHKIIAVSTVALGAESTQVIAGVVNYNLVSAVSDSNGTFDLFADVDPAIANADEFLSVNSGSISGHEGATFTLTAQFTSGPNVVIYSHLFSGGDVTTLSLSSIPLKKFNAGNLSRLLFSSTADYESQIFNFVIPAGTKFSFNQIPEPASATFLMGAVAAGVYATRRRRQPKALA